MTNPFLNFLKKLQQEMAPIEAAVLSEAEQVALAALDALVKRLVTHLAGAPAASSTTQAGS